MEVKFNDIIYKKNARNGKSLRDLCFNIFKQYLGLHLELSYKVIQELFNKMHCNNNFVVLSRDEWEEKTENQKNRYFDPIIYNKEELFFTTQWGNNGGNCDNINQMIDFAIKEEFSLEVINNEEDSNHEISTRNIMLYGAPGVGKTHNYKKLISMIEEGIKEQNIFKSISTNDNITDEYNDIFQNIKDEKRIEFVTFHQSYSYEDFIEGFRPTDGGNIKLEDGIFKEIAELANKNIEESNKDINTIKDEKTFFELFELYKDYIQEEIDANQKFTINNTAYITDIEKDAFRYTGDSWGNTQRMKFSDIELMNKLNICERKDIKKSEGLSGLANQHATYFSYLIKSFNKFQKKQKVKIDEVRQVNIKNFYIVIDEINRGNISKIFGELITLIEEDKRDDYEITLPYSKEKFKIPSNLFIIGTMNSTDKSIATIDIALRRRFTFLKMKPNEELINFYNAKVLMKNLNEFIGENIGEDYKLGHSYFMKVVNDEELEFVKEYKIKPLLEEYFYADEDNYKKVTQLLNEDVYE
ncbi:hypothetical protein LPB137_13095 [Poseidonibacter parvus]|uniref:AAA+ ATPase domain-containing protein n=1 Tax=Poseidonibacter parvus TaxID=1850254 RepID=A0A1P8KQ93_9BACT|nr:AAA family ATPase [Poseidonibacter parvus]APW66725.1 hypothetical protein LPB137_13095 [Poseidonibacter parvus]